MKRTPELEPLSHDHFEGLLVASRVAKGLQNNTPPALLSAYVSHFWQAHLSDHFRKEEDLLLPLANSQDSKALASQMLEEHATIKSLVDSIRDEPVSSAAFLLDLSRALKAHIRFEERILFPELEEEVALDRLREVGRRLAEDHETTKPEWTVPFWESNSTMQDDTAQHDTAQNDTAAPNSAATSVATATRDACLAAALSAYEDASISGLCREGAWENAVGAIKTIDIESVLKAARDD